MATSSERPTCALREARDELTVIDELQPAITVPGAVSLYANATWAVDDVFDHFITRAGTNAGPHRRTTP
jgi:hypothetical protein